MSRPDSTPFFSVIIPAYNAFESMETCLNSLLNQHRRPEEIIVVDDGSTDRTGDWEHRLADPSIHWIRRISNGGPGQARNTGIRKARGKYIAFLDADDEWHPEKLFLLEALLTEHPQIRFLFHDHIGKDQSFGEIPAQTRLYQYSWIKLLYRNPIVTPSVLVHRDEMLPFRDSLRYMEDYDLWLRISERTPVYYLPLALTRLGRPVGSPGGLSARHWAMRKGELRAFTYMAVRRPLRLPLLPFLWTYSLLKHGRKWLLKVFGSSR